MRRSRFLAVGLVLSLTLLFASRGRSQEPPPDSDSEPVETTRDPWAVLQSTPGVLVDRINVGGKEGGCGSGGPALSEESVDVGLGYPHGDEMLSAARAAAGVWPRKFDFDLSPTAVRLDGTGIAVKMPGPLLWPSQPRGTNQWRASGYTVGSGGGLSADTSVDGPDGPMDGNRIESLRTGSAWVGGPLSQDRLWIWGEVGLREVDQVALGGQKEERSGQNGSLKVNAQAGTSTSAVLAASRIESDGTGIGAGPSRAPETTWEEDGREALWTAAVTHIFSSDYYFTASLGQIDHRLGDLPRAADGEAQIGADGVAHGSWFGLRDERRTEQVRLDNQIWGSTGHVSHEISLGGGWRRQDEDQSLTPPGSLVLAGRGLSLADGSADGLAVLERWQTGQAGARTESWGLWAQDKLQKEYLSILIGLRADVQDLGLADGSRPWALAPRLGINQIVHTGESSRKTLLWASLDRFVAPLGSRAAWRVDPGAPAVLRSLFADLDGDLSPDPGTPVRPLPGEGIDPLQPGLDPDRVDPHLRPEIADEVAFGADHELVDDLWIGLRATWRRTSHLLEERLLVRNLASGEVFVATAGDWAPAGRLTGALPDGTPYDVPVWDLRPGLLWTGGTLLVNGDREREERALSLTWKRWLSGRWMGQGHITWQDADHRLGPDFRRFDDPTNAAGSGDDEGRPVFETASSSPHETPRHAAAAWSFQAAGLVRLPGGVNLSAAINGRRGYPLPYDRQVVRERAGLVRVQLTGRPDAVRMDDLVTVDAELEKELTLGDFSLTLTLQAVNLLNKDTVLEQELDLGVGRGGFADEVLAPRSLRMGVRMWWR